MSLSPQDSICKDYKDGFMIQPMNMNFQFDNDTTHSSSMPTPQNEERRISKGKIVAEKEENEEAFQQTDLNIDNFF